MFAVLVYDSDLTQRSLFQTLFGTMYVIVRTSFCFPAVDARYL